MVEGYTQAYVGPGLSRTTYGFNRASITYSALDTKGSVLNEENMDAANQNLKMQFARTFLGIRGGLSDAGLVWDTIGSRATLHVTWGVNDKPAYLRYVLKDFATAQEVFNVRVLFSESSLPRVSAGSSPEIIEAAQAQSLFQANIKEFILKYPSCF